MSEEKIVCPECGWSGAPSARCPNCGGALYRLSPGISEAPVETLPGQAAAGMSASKEMPEAPVEDRLVSVQAAGPEGQSSEWARKSEHWVELIRTLARELAKQVEDARKVSRSSSDSIRETDKEYRRAHDLARTACRLAEKGDRDGATQAANLALDVARTLDDWDRDRILVRIVRALARAQQRQRALEVAASIEDSFSRSLALGEIERT